MRKPQLVDYLLLTLLSLIWASAFFNIKIATYSFGPITIGFLRSFLGAPKKDLKKPIVIGPNEYVAIFILKKADAHINDNNVNNK